MRENEQILQKIITGQKIPLLAFVEPLLYGDYEREDFSVTEEEAFRDVKECGFDIIVGAQYCLSKNREIIIRILEQCEKQELLYLIRDNESFADKTQEEAEDYFRKMYAPFLKYRSFAGINPTDEPGYSAWEKVRKFRRAFHSVYPDKLYFVNLLQNYAPAWALPNGAENQGDLKEDTDYDFYCQSYIKQAKPQFFCYDFYPFRGKYPVMKERYFEQLETVQKYCSKENIPIWCFLQSCAFPEFGTFARVPSYEELLWQTNTSLCYGTKGFAYFCYWIPYDDENWFGAFTDIRGNKTITYENGRLINLHIQNLEKYFLRSKVCKVFRSNEIKEYETFDSMVQAQGEVIVSCLKDAEKEYIFVVNNSFEKRTEASLCCGKEVKAVTDVCNNMRHIIANGKASVVLGKGEGKLFTVEKGN